MKQQWQHSQQSSKYILGIYKYHGFKICTMNLDGEINNLKDEPSTLQITLKSVTQNIAFAL